MFNIEKYRSKVKGQKGHLSENVVLEMLNQIKNDIVNGELDTGRVINVGKVYKPREIAKYDIITQFVCNSAHPCIVYKVTPEYAYVISMSTTKADHNIYAFTDSRIFNGSYLTNTVIRVNKQQAIDHFVGIFDNIPEANQAFKTIRKLYKELFKTPRTQNNGQTHQTP